MDTVDTIFSTSTLEVLTVLTPGFIVVALIRQTSTTVDSNANNLILFMTALFHSIVITTIVNIINGLRDTIDNELLILIIVTALYSLFIAYIVNNDLLMRLLRLIGITTKVESPSVWHSAFKKYKKSPVIIRFKDKTCLYGHAEFRSTSKDNPSLFLRYPYTKNDDNEWILDTQCIGYLITKEKPIETIEFVDPKALKNLCEDDS